MKEEKNLYIDELKNKVNDSSHLMIADYSNMKMSDFNLLRDKLNELNCKFHVVKNTLAKLLIKASNLPEKLLECFNGQNALIFGGDDTAGIAKVINNFNKDTEKGIVKGGILDGDFLSKEQFAKLANLPSKEILQGKLLGVLLAPAQKLVRTANEPATSLVRVLNAKKE